MGVMITQPKYRQLMGLYFVKHRQGHKEILSLRTSKNISNDKAKTDHEVVAIYFMNLEKALEGISPENQRNYDETNLEDDCGSKNVISQRGAKYPHQGQN